MIVGTAGHIDHGKTTLVKALTGVDADRLPEEKRRGISIELGYAYLRSDDGVSIGFVDVPGHERLLHTMLAGATGIDHALLLVAADDGVMPQTREHLAVLSLLGLGQGCVAITKTDRVDAERLRSVEADVVALLDGTPLAQAPRFPLSAVSGDGVEALREHLFAAARQHRRQDDGRAFRLAIDRAFSLRGVGTVVTGTVHSGSVRVGDELMLLPLERKVRVRSVHANNSAADSAHAGQRCALALVGVEAHDLGRGHWICDSAVALVTQRVDVQLQLWRDETASLRSGTTLHVHLGTSDVLGSVALLEADALAPGAGGLAQLVLRAPLGAWHGDRGVLRDASATRTVAGFRVLDPVAPARYRRTPERLAMLAARGAGDAATRGASDVAAQVAALLTAAPLGVDTRALARSLALHEPRLPLPAGAIRIDDAQAPAAIALNHCDALCDRITAALAAFHASSPEEVGPDTRRLKRLAGPRVPEPVWRHALATLITRGALAKAGAWLHLPSHAAALSQTQEALAAQLLPLLEAGAFDPPWVRDLAREVAAPEATVRATLAALARQARVHAVVRDLYYPAATLERLAGLARDVASVATEGATPHPPASPGVCSGPATAQRSGSTRPAPCPLRPPDRRRFPRNGGTASGDRSA